MSKNIYDIISEREEAVKTAVVAALGGMLLRGAGGLSRAVLKRPMASIGAAFAGSDIVDGTKRFTNITAKNRQNPFQVP